MTWKLGHEIKAILFDKDGTLIDFDKTWAETNRKGALIAADGDTALADALHDGLIFGAGLDVFERELHPAAPPGAKLPWLEGGGDAAHAVGVARVGHFHEHRLDLGQVERRGHAVVQESWVHHLA